MDRDIEILFETIADNLELLKQDEGDFDIGIFEEICDNQGFDLQGYLNAKNNRPGRFRNL